MGDFCGLLGISVVSGDMKIRMSNLKFKSFLDSNLSTYTKIEMSKAHWEKVQNVKRGQMPCQSYSSYKPGEKLAIAVYTAIDYGVYINHNIYENVVNLDGVSQNGFL